MLTLDFQGVVGRLLSKAEDNTMLISRFTEYLEMVDVRFYVMSAIRENVGLVMVKSKGVGSTTAAWRASARTLYVRLWMC